MNFQRLCIQGVWRCLNHRNEATKVIRVDVLSVGESFRTGFPYIGNSFDVSHLYYYFNAVLMLMYPSSREFDMGAVVVVIKLKVILTTMFSLMSSESNSRTQRRVQLRRNAVNFCS